MSIELWSLPKAMDHNINLCCKPNAPDQLASCEARTKSTRRSRFGAGIALNLDDITASGSIVVLHHGPRTVELWGTLQVAQNDLGTNG
jgi:hypothetical protein